MTHQIYQMNRQSGIPANTSGNSKVCKLRLDISNMRKISAFGNIPCFFMCRPTTFILKIKKLKTTAEDVEAVLFCAKFILFESDIKGTKEAKNWVL